MLVFTFAAHAQKKTQPNVSTDAAALPLVRTTTRHETKRMGYGGTFTLRGAPVGSITIEAWNKSEVDITADIELRAATEDDLARLAAVNTFVVTTDLNHISVVTTGTHDRQFMKRNAKNFPKNLLSAPWRIDYKIRVPAMCDLEVSNGRGAVRIAGVEGAISLEADESDAALALIGGDVAARIGSGAVDVKLIGRNWRGRGADIKLAKGDLTVEIPAVFNGDFNAETLLSGRVENEYKSFKPLDENDAGDSSNKSLRVRAGGGGPTLRFTVGQGSLRLKQAANN